MPQIEFLPYYVNAMPMVPSMARSVTAFVTPSYSAKGP